MKNLICSFLILSIFLLASCEKEDPEIAPIDELSALSFSESFVCQPLAFDNYLVALINRNNLNSLCAYDEQGNKLWQKPVDEYIIPGVSYSELNYIKIAKLGSGSAILNMFVIVFDKFQSIENQIFKAVSFDVSGNFKWQLMDSIHQPDTIIIQQDTIAMDSIFIIADSFQHANGNHIVLSYQIDEKSDSTFLQFSNYNENGSFQGDNYLKIKGKRLIYNIFLTSDNELLMFNEIPTQGQSYILMDFAGEIKFEIMSDRPILENYFFHETRQGEFLISSSVIDISANYKGVVLNVDKAGNILWRNNLNNPQATIVMSVTENADSYIFSGFNTESTILTGVDWRTTFSQNKFNAVLQKTDLNGQEIWRQMIPGIINTSGAASIGTDNISFFAGKYDIAPGGKNDNSVKNIILLKLNPEGLILN